MSHRRAPRVVVLFAVAVCAFVHGCQSTSSVGSVLARHGSGGAGPAVAAGTLAPGMEVEWHVKTAKASPGFIHSGLSVIGPDGKMEMGPYGSCRVAGQTPDKARETVEKHLASYVRNPVVTLAAQPVGGGAAEVAWRPTSTDSVSAAWWQAGKEGAPAGDKEKKDEKKQNEFELIPPPKAMVPPSADLPPGPDPVHVAGAPSEQRILATGNEARVVGVGPIGRRHGAVVLLEAPLHLGEEVGLQEIGV